MKMPTLFIESVALWSSNFPSWESACAGFRSELNLFDPPMKRPAPELLASTERRRAPDTVVLALEVALRAVEQSGFLAAELPSVFTSAHGDLAISDYMCATLASEPTSISPTKFHNSVHNASAGYWTIGTGCMQASTALTAFEFSFAAGLLEAATQCAANLQPVLLVGYDISACGALTSVTKSCGLLAAALVLSPVRSHRSIRVLDWSLCSGPVSPIVLRSVAAQSMQTNAMADCLPLLEALALDLDATVLMPLSSVLALRIELGRVQ